MVLVKLTFGTGAEALGPSELEIFTTGDVGAGSFFFQVVFMVDRALVFFCLFIDERADGLMSSIGG